MPLGRAREPFSHPEWIFEIKWDGFRSLAYVEHGACRLVSRNGNEFKSFQALNREIAAGLRGRSAVLDGEIVCLDEQGKSQFHSLLFRRGEPRFYAFDLLWVDGEDSSHRPLIERKSRLRRVLRGGYERLLYCDHVDGDGEGLFHRACQRDLEGIVAKYKQAPYHIAGENHWLEIRDRAYSQWAGREELFERESERDPDLGSWLEFLHSRLRPSGWVATPDGTVACLSE